MPGSHMGFIPRLLYAVSLSCPDSLVLGASYTRSRSYLGFMPDSYTYTTSEQYKPIVIHRSHPLPPSRRERAYTLGIIIHGLYPLIHFAPVEPAKGMAHSRIAWGSLAPFMTTGLLPVLFAPVEAEGWDWCAYASPSILCACNGGLHVREYRGVDCAVAFFQPVTATTRRGCVFLGPQYSL